MRLKHFTLDEFDSPDLPGSGDKMSSNFLKKLDKARSIADTPFKINSGYRTPKHNKTVGGKPGSSHTQGLAADIHCNNDTTRSLIVQALIEVWFTRIGIAKTLIHVDSDETKNSNRIWVY